MNKRNIVVNFVVILFSSIVLLYGNAPNGMKCKEEDPEIINYLPCKVIDNMCQVQVIARECVKSDDPASNCDSSSCHTTAEMLKTCVQQGGSLGRLVCMAVTD